MQTARNYWPLGIILAFILFIAGTAGLIVLASTRKVDLVSANYYEQEIKYQSRIDSLNRAQQLGLLAAVTCDAAGRRLTITLPAEHVERKASGHIQLYRPSAVGMDREYRLEPNPDGVQSLDLSDLQTGLWKVRVSWTVGDQDYFLDQKIVLGKAVESPH